MSSAFFLKYHTLLLSILPLLAVPFCADSPWPFFPAAATILVQTPYDGERGAYGILLCIASSIAGAVLMIFRVPCELQFLTAMLLLLSSLVLRTFRGHLSVNESRVLFLRYHILACGCMLFLLARGRLWLMIPCALVFVMVSVHAVAERSLVRMRLTHQLRGYSRRKSPVLKDDPQDGRRFLAEKQRMKDLYDKMIDIMESEKPYLKANCTLSDMAVRVYSNKTYLSRSINTVSDKNFCTLVKYYRVKYAMELLIQSPEMRMQEIALKSGFNSLSSFTGAFKDFYGITPFEYSQKLKIVGFPSMRKEEEQSPPSESSSRDERS